MQLARRLDSAAIAGEGVQNLMCAAQAAATLVSLIGAGVGLGFLDPIAALVVSAIAVKSAWGCGAATLTTAARRSDSAARQAPLVLTAATAAERRQSARAQSVAEQRVRAPVPDSINPAGAADNVRRLSARSLVA
jgi:hypothetical protein